MKTIAVLDWGAISKGIWLALPSKSKPWTRRTELEEGSHRICEWVYSLYKEHQWDHAIIAQDSSPYWRHEVMEEFYSQSPIYKLDGAYYAFFDGVYQHIDQTSGELTKQKADMNKRLAKEAIAIDIDERSSLPKISWPRYKGNRKNREWPCETSVEDFHKVQIGLANRIAPLIKGITVAVPRAEADDIAAIVTTMAQNHKLVLCSSDSDWRQVFRSHANSVWHDLYHNQRVHSTPEEIAKVREVLKKKIIGGEPGDGIKGCPRLDNKGWSCVSEAGAEKIIESKDYSVLDVRYMQRNKKLIEMTPANIPLDLQQAVLLDVQRIREPIPEVSWGWSDLGLTKREMERLEMEANSDRVFGQWFGSAAEEKLMGMLDKMAENQKVVTDVFG